MRKQDELELLEILKAKREKERKKERRAKFLGTFMPPFLMCVVLVCLVSLTLLFGVGKACAVLVDPEISVLLIVGIVVNIVGNIGLCGLLLGMLVSNAEDFGE